MKRAISLSILAVVTLIVLAAPVLAAQLFTFDTDSQGWTGTYSNDHGHLANGCMDVEPGTPMSKSLVIGAGNVDFFVEGNTDYTLTIRIDGSRVCTNIMVPSSWQSRSCMVTGSGSSRILLFESESPPCVPEFCPKDPSIYIDEISVPEVPPTPTPFHLWLPLLFRAGR